MARAVISSVSTSGGLRPIRFQKSTLGLALWLWLGCSAVYFLTAPGRLDIIDGAYRYEATQSIIDIGRPIVRHPWLVCPIGRNGEKFSMYPLGTSLIAVPLVMAGGWLGAGSVESKQFAFSLVTIPFASGCVAVLFLTWVHLGVPLRQAAGWAIAVAFATPLWPYAGSTFDMTIQAFLLLVGICAAVQAIGQPSLRWAAVSGLCFAVLVNVVELYLVLAIAVLADFPIRAKTLFSRCRQPAVWVVAAGATLGVVLLMAYNFYAFGSPVKTGRVSAPHPFVGILPLGIVGLFLSPAKSIILYCPLYVAALLRTRGFVRSNLRLYAPIAACITLQILIVAELRFWAGEWAWGPRYLVATLPLVCLGLPFATSGRWPGLLKVAIGLGVVVQLLAISVDHQRFYFAREHPRFFWLDERKMYTESALFARPAELWSVIRDERAAETTRLVPALNELSMTSSIFGPSPDRDPSALEWMEQFMVFRVPRPWTLWSPRISPNLRPGPTMAMTVAGLTIAGISFVAVYRRTKRR